MSKSIAEIARNPLRAAVLVGLGIALALLLVIARDSLAASDVGNFEIDRTGGTTVPAKASYYSGVFQTVPSDGPGADDWVFGTSGEGVYELSAGAPHTAFENCYGSNIDVNAAITGIVAMMCDGFAKIDGFPEQNLVSPNGSIPDDVWPIKAGSLGVPKDDLSHGYYLQRTQACGFDGKDHTIVIVGMERGNNEGDNHWGIELDAVAPTGLSTIADNVSPAADFALDFNRRVGDVFISVDLTRGGGDPNILVTTIDGPDVSPADGVVDAGEDAHFALASPTGTCTGEFANNRTATNIIEQTAPPWNIITCDPTTADDGANKCRIANETGTGAAADACGSKNSPEDCIKIAERDFVEIAIDLTAHGIDQGCFASVLLTSRSSPGGGIIDPDEVTKSLDKADVKDITASLLPPCDITIEKVDADTGQFIGPFTTTITPDPFRTDCSQNTGSLQVTDQVAPDDDAALGVIHLSNVCPGTYTATEDVAPPGYSLDPDGSDPVECTVGPASGSTSCTFVFEDPLGDLTINKNDDLGNPQGGATFSITPNPFVCHQAGEPADGLDHTSDPLIFTDNDDPPDDNPADGVIELSRVCIPDNANNEYTVTETQAPSGFALPADVDDTCEVSENTNPEQSCTVTFQNRLGTIEWEKRLLDNGPPHPLHGLADFSVSPNPFACHGGTDPGTFTDNDDPPDKDPTTGQIKLERVCMGTYTITEEDAPANSLKDEDVTRVVIVDDPNVAGGTDELNPVVGGTGGSTGQGFDDDARSSHGIGDCPTTAGEEECDFHNRQASIIIRKEAKDASTVATDDLLCGATFKITPDPLDGDGSLTIIDVCHPGTPDSKDEFTGATGDGLICIDNVIPGTNYSIEETAAPANYNKADPATQNNISSSVGSCADRTTSDTADATFVNDPLSSIEVIFTSLAQGAQGDATKAQIVCEGPGGTEVADSTGTPPGDDAGENGADDNATPVFDDTDEIFTGLVEGTYICTIIIDP